MSNSLEFENAKRESLERLEELLINVKGLEVEESLKLWCKFTELEFFSFQFWFDPRKIYTWMDKEDSSSYELDLYDSDYIKKAWREKEKEGLAGEQTFIIGGVEGADEFIFVTKEFSGISILHHEDAFLTDDLDKLIGNDISRKNCSIAKLFELLNEKSS